MEKYFFQTIKIFSIVVLGVLMGVGVFAGTWKVLDAINKPNLSLREIALPTSVPTGLPTVVPTDTTQVLGTQTSGNSYSNPSLSPLINCLGPDKKYLQVTQKQCDDFNAAWSNASVKLKPQNSPGNTQNTTNRSTPYQDNRISCTTLSGVYYVSQETCNSMHHEDQLMQGSSQEIQGQIQQSQIDQAQSQADLQQQMEADRQANLQQCLTNADNQKQQAINGAQAQGLGSSETINQQIESNYTQSVNLCHTNYGY